MSHSSLFLFTNVIYVSTVPGLDIFMSPKFLRLKTFFKFYFTYLFYIPAVVFPPSSPPSVPQTSSVSTPQYT